VYHWIEDINDKIVNTYICVHTFSNKEQCVDDVTERSRFIRENEICRCIAVILECMDLVECGIGTVSAKLQSAHSCLCRCLFGHKFCNLYYFHFHFSWSNRKIVLLLGPEYARWF